VRDRENRNRPKRPPTATAAAHQKAGVVRAVVGRDLVEHAGARHGEAEDAHARPAAVRRVEALERRARVDARWRRAGRGRCVRVVGARRDEDLDAFRGL
jgi:hypothetical protein